MKIIKNKNPHREVFVLMIFIFVDYCRMSYIATQILNKEDSDRKPHLAAP